MKSTRTIKALFLSGAIIMSVGCGNNVQLQTDGEATAANGKVNAESSVTSVSDKLNSGDISTEDIFTSEEALSAEEGIEREPTMVYSENSFAEIRTDIMDTDGEIIFAAKDSGGAWGYINTSGEWVIQPQFSEAYNFSCGYAVVVGADGKYCFIDRDGNKSLGDYDGIYNWGGFNGFNHGYARVYKGDEYQIINTEGGVVNSDKRKLMEENSRIWDGSGGDWYNYLGGCAPHREHITDTGSCFSTTKNYMPEPDVARTFYSYQGDTLGYGYIVDGTDNYFLPSHDSGGRTWNTTYQYKVYSKEHEDLATYTMENSNGETDIFYLTDNAYAVEEKNGSESLFTVYSFDNTQINQFNAASVRSIGDDMLLLKNGVGNYSIIGTDGTEYMPYAIGREPLTTTNASLAITIDGKKYIVFQNPNVAQPTYEYFSIEEKKLVEMDEKYGLYLPHRQSVNGEAMILEKDEYVMAMYGLKALTGDTDGSEFMADTEVSTATVEYSNTLNAQFCFENNLYVVNHNGWYIGHIEY